MKKNINRLAVIAAFVLMLSVLSFTIVSYAASDTKGPEIDLSSIMLSKNIISDYLESPTVKLKVTDESEITELTLYYTLNGKSSGANAYMSFNENTGYFESNIIYRSSDCATGSYAACYGEY